MVLISTFGGLYPSTLVILVGRTSFSELIQQKFQIEFLDQYAHCRTNHYGLEYDDWPVLGSEGGRCQYSGTTTKTPGPRGRGVRREMNSCYQKRERNG